MYALCQVCVALSRGYLAGLGEEVVVNGKPLATADERVPEELVHILIWLHVQPLAAILIHTALHKQHAGEGAREKDAGWLGSHPLLLPERAQ